MKSKISGLSIRYSLLTLLSSGLVLASQTAISREHNDANKIHKLKLRRGVIYGKVLDLNGKPIANAVVAVRQADGKVLTWARTDEKGSYELAADPKVALNLKATHAKGVFEQCARAVEDVALAPIKAVGSMVSNPGPIVHAAAVSVASGTPGPVVLQATQALFPNSNTPGQVLQQEGGVATDAALTPTKAILPPPAVRGEASILVSASGFKDAEIKDAAYWLDPAVEDKKAPMGVQAYLQSIKLAPTEGDKKCDVVIEAVTLNQGVAQPSLIPAGEDVVLKVRLAEPDPVVQGKIRIFARLASKDTVIELNPSVTDLGLYTGTMHIDPNTPEGTTAIAIGALRAFPIEVKLPKRGDPMGLFVKRLDAMNANLPYGYDPFVMAGVNRMDLKVTILSNHP